MNELQAPCSDELILQPSDVQLPARQTQKALWVSESLCLWVLAVAGPS